MGTLRDLRTTGPFGHSNDFNPPIAVNQLAQQSLQEYVLDFANFRVHDNFGVILPNAGATDDLGLVGGTFGTAAPSLQTEDLKTAGATSNYARFMVRLPPEYVAAQTVILNFVAGMITTVADTTATLDLVCHLNDEDNTVSADICATAATDINFVAPAFVAVPFTITATTLSPGSVLDCRIVTAVNDGAGGAAVIGCVAKAALQCDTQG
jgi:acyl-coenzyme A thioesterase PaaI-like protein